MFVLPSREVEMSDDQNAALSRIRLPATSLLVVGLIDAVSAIGIIVSGFFTGAFRMGPQEGIIGILALGASIVIIVGARRMRRARGLGLARAASVLAMLPCLSPCFLVGLPVGIWALVLLSLPETKSSFR
jgi:hypothetical protein